MPSEADNIIVNESEVVNQIETQSPQPIVSETRKRPNKTLKKKMRYLKKLEFYKQKKQQKKLDKKLKKENNNKIENENSNEKVKDENLEPIAKKPHKMKRFQRANINEKLKKIHENNELSDENLKVCIDCSYCSLMSEKEQSRLAQQIGRCYASNRAAIIPAQITLTNIDKESYFYKEMCRVNDGFERYIMIKSEKSIEELHSDNLDKLCYLSPDSDKILDCLDRNKIYVIGGLVDETVTKKVTLTKSNNLKLNCYRLPIEEFMSRRSNDEENDKKYNFNKILSLNQVLDILLNYNENKDWKIALQCGVPPRKGFFIKNDS